jgi:hypothetical protein
MTKVTRGVVRGRMIELDEDLGVSEGQVVDLIVTASTPCAQAKAPSPSRRLPKAPPGPPPGWRAGAPSKVAGILSEEWSEEDDRILEQIQAERKGAKWRELPE